MAWFLSQEQHRLCTFWFTLYYFHYVTRIIIIIVGGGMVYIRYIGWGEAVVNLEVYNNVVSVSATEEYRRGNFWHYMFWNLELDVRWWLDWGLGSSASRKEAHYQKCKKLGGPQSRSGRFRNEISVLTPPGIELLCLCCPTHSGHLLHCTRHAITARRSATTWS